MSYHSGSLEMQYGRIKMEVDNLRVHSSMVRTPLSKTISDMKDYCEKNEARDPLINPVKENPFKEKRSFNMSTIAQQKKVVEQLRMECNMQRKPVSECIKDMVSFMEENNSKDHLLIGFASKKDNPFQEKSGCTIL